MEETDFFWDTDHPGLYQGVQSGWSDKEYVGILLFTEMAKSNWKARNIKSISFNFYSTASGNFSLYQCTDKVDLSTGKKGSYYQGDLIGTLKHASGNNNFTFSNTSNSEIFSGLVQYLQSTDSVQNICISDKGQTDKIYRITAITISIEYDEGLVYYGVGGKWQPCLVYYGVNGKWQQVIPYYGVNGKWQQLGGG
jgi:hypothetical protein